MDLLVLVESASELAEAEAASIIPRLHTMLVAMELAASCTSSVTNSSENYFNSFIYLLYSSTTVVSFSQKI